MSRKLATEGLTKIFGTTAAIADVTMEFAPGRIHAILGENGAGKSTLMKLLFGLHKPSRGRILLDGQEVRWRNSMDAIEHGLGMVQQHFSLVGPMSAIDNIMLGAEKVHSFGQLDRQGAIDVLEKLLPSQSLAVPWLEPVENLAVGQKQRIEILKLLFRKAEILFLDEPTAVLTPQEVKDFFDVLRKLKAAGRTIVLITHKIHEVLELCDTYTILRQGRLVARGEVATATHDSLIEGMIGRRLNDQALARKPARPERVFSCQQLSEPLSGRGCIRDVSLDIAAGEIVGIAGVEGAGQSHFVEAIMGLRPFQGTAQLLGRELEPMSVTEVRARGTALIPESRLEQGLWPEAGADANMIIGIEDSFTSHGFLNKAAIAEASKKWAKEFDVRAPSLQTPARALSGGNQQKLIFAREIVGRNPKFLICHQPTRGVDLGAIEIIHHKLLELRNQGLGILVISSELDELIKLCDRMVVFFDGRVVARFERHEFEAMQIGAAMTGVVNG